MEALAIAKLILDNAPAAIETAEQLFEWGKSTWASVKEATGKPDAEITADELLAHIAQIKSQSDEIQSIGN